MNKGVELLLARRRTNPEEFAPQGKRWDTILKSFEAYPLTRDTKPCNPREFNKLVMDRLLTASDLAEPWKVRLTQAQIQIAQKMGVKVEDYAKKLLELERRQKGLAGGNHE